MGKKVLDEEQVVQLEEDLHQFLSDWSPHINLDNELVNIRINLLSEAAIASLADDVELEVEDGTLEFDGTMDDYSFGEEDD